jgi:hypothetical protein
MHDAVPAQLSAQKRKPESRSLVSHSCHHSRCLRSRFASFWLACARAETTSRFLVIAWLQASLRVSGSRCNPLPPACRLAVACDEYLPRFSLSTCLLPRSGGQWTCTTWAVLPSGKKTRRMRKLAHLARTAPFAECASPGVMYPRSCRRRYRSVPKRRANLRRACASRSPRSNLLLRRCHRRSTEFRCPSDWVRSDPVVG